MVASELGACTLMYREFHHCGAPAFFGKKDPIASQRSIAYVVTIFWTRFWPKGLKFIFIACLMRDRARDWWEDHTLGVEAIEVMTWADFVTMFWEEFVPAIDIQ